MDVAKIIIRISVTDIWETFKLEDRERKEKVR